MRDLWLGVMLGIMLGTTSMAVIVAVFGPGKLWEHPHEEMLRDYEAYSACIPKPRCMTAEDFIDYYNLKWRLQAMRQ